MLDHGANAVEKKFFEISVIKSYVRWISGHCNKSIRHSDVVHQVFGRTNAVIHPMPLGEGPGNVAGFGDVTRIDGYCDTLSLR